MQFTELIKQNHLFDSHCHLTELDLDAISSSVNRIKHIISIATDIANAVGCRKLAMSNPEMISATIGVDPDYVIPNSSIYQDEKKPLQQLAQEIREQLSQFEFCMIGECGIDNYHIQKQALSNSEKEAVLKEQEALFRMQCEIAQQYNLPLSVHSRGAEQRCLEIVNEYEVVAVFHSFTGESLTAKRIIDFGHYLGVNGIITYKSAGDLRKLYQEILGKISEPNPLDFYNRHIVFETDAPWLRPFNSSLKNSPSQIVEIFSYLTKLVS